MSNCIAEYTADVNHFKYNAFLKGDIWICVPLIPNKYVREAIPIMLSDHLCLTLFASFCELNMNLPLVDSSITLINISSGNGLKTYKKKLYHRNTTVTTASWIS